MDSFPETYINPFLVPSYSFEVITRTKRSDLGDDKANGKKAIGLISKTTTLHVHNTVFSIFFLPSLHHYDANTPNFTFYGSRNKRQRNFLSLSKSGYGSQEFNSKRQGHRQPIIKTCWPGPTNFWFDHSTPFNKSCVVGVR